MSSIKSGNLASLKDHYDSSTSLNDIARQAARYAQPQILSWCYTQGWTPQSPSLNDQFYIDAIDGASPAIFQVLLDHNWDINAHEIESVGDALACAVMSGNYEFAKWLLEHGHRSTPHDPMFGESAVVTTVRGETASMDMLELLLEHGIVVKGLGVGIAAADEGNTEGLRKLLDYGVGVEERDMYWYPFDEERDEPESSEGTALYRACRQGRVECVKLLLDRGADAYAKDEGGVSCLEIARRRGHEDVVKLLEDRGVTG